MGGLVETNACVESICPCFLLYDNLLVRSPAQAVGRTRTVQFAAPAVAVDMFQPPEKS